MGKMFDVFNYWKNKCITENGEVQIEYGYEGCNPEQLDLVDSIPVVEDWGEPTCFACNCAVLDLLDRDNYVEMLNSDDFDKKIWNSKEVSRTLERAHIIPKSLGGDNSSSNIFCLCKTCHKYSPDSRFPKEFFRWVYNERKNPRQRKIINKAMQICREENILPLFDYKKDVDVFKNITSHGGEVVASSVIATLVGNARERNKIIVNAFLHKDTDCLKEVLNNEDFTRI